MITTLNLSVFLLDYVKNRLERIDVGVKDFILLCLKRKVRERYSADYKFFRAAVLYQPKGGGYVRVKVGFSWDEYDANLLCRFVWKISVSRLAAMAVHEYADEIIKELNGEKVVKDNSTGQEVFIRKINKINIYNNGNIVDKYQITLTHPPER